MGAGVRRRVTNLLGGVAMVATLAGLAFGLPAVDRSLPAERPVPGDRPYQVGAGVSVVPPAGATLDVTRTRRGAREASALFVIGQVRYAIVVRPFAGNLSAAAVGLRHRITRTAGYQVTGAELVIATAGGLTGLQGGYTAGGRGGRYAVFRVGGLVIEVTVSGGDLHPDRTLAAVKATTDSIRYRASR